MTRWHSIRGRQSRAAVSVAFAAAADNSGRGVAGVNDKTVFAETIPPADPFGTRTLADPRQGTTVATIEGYVTAAEQNGGGWVQLTFHHICSSCDAYSITRRICSRCWTGSTPRSPAAPSRSRRPSR
jgi:hypothetical protein